MRVRNTKSVAVGVQRFSHVPGPDEIVSQHFIVSETVAPGESKDIDDAFFVSEGAKALIADGTFVVESVPKVEPASKAAVKNPGGAK